MPDWSAKQIQMRDTTVLNPYDRNPRIHPDSQIEQLKNSIRQWGWTVPILIDESDTVLAGHGRLHAASEMGISEVPCVIAVGWSDEQKRAYVIADNKLAENSSWDTGLYFSEIKALDDIGFDLSIAGLDQDILASVNFEPTLNPSTQYEDVTSDDINLAASTVGEIKPHGQKVSDVICPHCGEEFQVAGQ
ncbi:MAG: hypothetical protein CMF19_03405 [Idiomarinaceae bacterium]|nr:hypothetical protein [Idiomarinaceae bacterium]